MMPVTNMLDTFSGTRLYLVTAALGRIVSPPASKAPFNVQFIHKSRSWLRHSVRLSSHQNSCGICKNLIAHQCFYCASKNVITLIFRCACISLIGPYCLLTLSLTDWYFLDCRNNCYWIKCQQCQIVKMPKCLNHLTTFTFMGLPA